MGQSLSNKIPAFFHFREELSLIHICYVPLGAPMVKSFDDEFFGEWLEEPVAFGAFEGERLLGYVAGSYTHLLPRKLYEVFRKLYFGS